MSDCTASHPPPELAEFWASFPGLRAFDSAPSLPTAELAQEHLGELQQVSSRLWVGVEPELCDVGQASAGSLRSLRVRREQGSQVGPAD